MIYLASFKKQDKVASREQFTSMGEKKNHYSLKRTYSAGENKNRLGALSLFSKRS